MPGLALATVCTTFVIICDVVLQDMTRLTFMHEPGVLWNLRQRYSGSCIYTRTGGILIAVNPFAPLPHLYGHQVMEQYSQGDVMEMEPHVYAIASAAYQKMRRTETGQAILVSHSNQLGS